MIKKVLFDLDNTLIKWENNYKYLSMMEVGIDDPVLAKQIDIATSKYEENIDHLSRESFTEYILSLGINITKEKLNELIDKDCNRYQKASKELIELLEYLSSKYELAVVTNWFGDIQSKRLENAGILKYFEKVYSSDKYTKKPNKEIFIAAQGNYKANECLMVGDSVDKDIIPAYNLGMNVILIGKSDKYKSVNNVVEIKEML